MMPKDAEKVVDLVQYIARAEALIVSCESWGEAEKAVHNVRLVDKAKQSLKELLQTL